MFNDSFSGAKEMYDVNIKVNQPLEFNGRKYMTNETLLLFESVELATVNEIKSERQATGGYHNNVLINWEVDKEIQFNLKNGILSPVSWAILSNSKINNIEKKSVPIVEILQPTIEKDYCFVDLKFKPNGAEPLMGIQENPNLEPLPMGRRPELELKPLPPSKTKFFLCYDYNNGKIIKDCKIYGNRVYFNREYDKVYIDYTFEYEDKIKVIEVGNRLFNGFLRLTGKMSVKDEKSGEITTAILEIPKLKLSSNLAIRLGKEADHITVSDFYFVGYPDESIRREKQSTCKLTFLNHELTEDYI